MSGDAERQRLLHVSDQDASGDEPDQNFVEDAGKVRAHACTRADATRCAVRCGTVDVLS